jgi:ABC-2 type transport system permease protein
VEETLSSYEQDYDYFILEYLDGSRVKDDEIDRFIASPMRGLLAVLLMLTGLAAILYLTQDCRLERFVWIPAYIQPPFRFLYLLIPLTDVALALLAALCVGGSFTNLSTEIPALILFVLQVAGFSNLLRVLLRRQDFMASPASAARIRMMMRSAIVVQEDLRG